MATDRSQKRDSASPARPLTFRATIEIRGINPYVRVSAALANRLKPGWRRPLPVSIRVNGQPSESPWRINMMPTGDGDFYLYLHGIVRKASDTTVGDRVRVEIELDRDYQSGPDEMPDMLQSVFRKNRQARAAYDALTPSRQKEIVRYFGRLKSPEAQQRYITRVLETLGANQ